MDHCLRSRHYVNVVIAGKHPAPQWLTMDAAVKGRSGRQRELRLPRGLMNAVRSSPRGLNSASVHSSERMHISGTSFMGSTNILLAF